MDKILEFTTIGLLLMVIFKLYLPEKGKKTYQTKKISMLVDTSAVMDGRVVDIAKTGFLLGQIIVPKSVLAELQLLADGADHLKRERARFGMDVIKQLKDILGKSFILLQDDNEQIHNVDDQLIYLAKTTDSAVLTLDYNLNKVAQVEGVTVLNVNELAKSLRMINLPGDILQIDLLQKGQSNDQAVGYLSDGTMVVVDQAKKYIGKTVTVNITRSLQTDAGRMMFAKIHTTPKPTRNSKPSGTSQKTTKTKLPIKKSNDNKQNRQPKRQPKPKTSAQHEDALMKLVDRQ